MSPSNELNTVLDMIRKRAAEVRKTTDDERLSYERIMANLSIDDDITTSRVGANGVPAEWISAPESAPDRVILYLHGGGYVIGSVRTHRALTAHLARAARSRILAIDYRLAPEFPFPAPVEDAVSSYQWLLAQGISPTKIVIAGDSSGGGLVVATLVALKNVGEPMPGAGSDPSAMLTTAEKKGDKWVIHGHKTFITGAQGAKHFILVAKTSDDPRKGLTAFLFDADQPGWKIKRRIPIMGPEEHGGHCELIFEGLEIPDENRLLEIGDGLKVTQIRLGTARLTHCMRWLGLAKRALEIASTYVEERKSFGATLAEHEGVQWMVGEAAKDIQIGRLLVMHAAWKLEQGDFARKEVSMAKIQVADTLHSAVDTAIQLCGARGYSKDTLLEWMYRYARQARLVDGASEVHKMVLSRTLLNEGTKFWAWN